MARIVFGFLHAFRTPSPAQDVEGPFFIKLRDRVSVRMASLRLRRTSRFLAIRLSRFGYRQQARRGRVGDDVGRPCKRGTEQHGGDAWWRKRRRIPHRGHVCQHNERVSR